MRQEGGLEPGKGLGAKTGVGGKFTVGDGGGEEKDSDITKTLLTDQKKIRRGSSVN